MRKLQRKKKRGALLGGGYRGIVLVKNHKTGSWDKWREEVILKKDKETGKFHRETILKKVKSRES